MKEFRLKISNKDLIELLRTEKCKRSIYDPFRMEIEGHCTNCDSWEAEEVQQ